MIPPRLSARLSPHSTECAPTGTTTAAATSTTATRFQQPQHHHHTTSTNTPRTTTSTTTALPPRSPPPAPLPQQHHLHHNSTTTTTIQQQYHLHHNHHNHHHHPNMATQGGSTTTTIQAFASELAGRHSWLCIIYAKGCTEDQHLENLCLEIGDFQQTGGLCIIANTEDPDNMALLSSTVEVANTYNAPIFSISLGEEELPHGAVRSADHAQVSSPEGEGGQGGDQYYFVTEVLSEILKILKRRRG